MIVGLIAAGDFGPWTNAWKALPFLLVLMVWLRLLTWVDKDSRHALMPRELVNAGMISGLLLGIAIFLLIGNWILGMFAMLAIIGIEAAIYLAVRHQNIGLKDLNKELNDGMKSIVPAKHDKTDQIAEAGQVTLVGRSGRHIVQPEAEDAARLGYDITQLLLGDPLFKKAHTIELTVTAQAAASRFWVDGFPYDGVAIDKAHAGEGIAYIKSMIGLDPNERRKPQAGEFKVIIDGERRDIRVATRGSSQGEVARLEVDVPARYTLAPDQLGLLPEQLQYLQRIKGEGGIVLLACPREHGLTALQYAMLRLHDAFVEQILTIEHAPPVDLEGITQNKLPVGAPQAEEARVAAWITSQDPDVILCGGLETAEAARTIVDFASRGKRVYVGVRATDVFGAIDVWKRLVGDAPAAVGSLRAVLAGRLFRKLCEATKIPYQPDERLLRQLGLGAGQVTELYKPHFGPLIDARGNEVPDTFCQGLGYRGRFGVYELLDIDEQVMASLESNAGLNTLRQHFRRQRGRYIQEIALSRVASGDTSVQEFLRVLKAESKDPSPAN
jgi:type II secretory ATPase GspE/PulE/Tfp pilus assembly ATPase PilB-like protein